MVTNQFKPVDLTKEMAETYYYNRQDFWTSTRNEANVFWLDYVQWDESKGGSFLSQVTIQTPNIWKGPFTLPFKVAFFC